MSGEAAAKDREWLGADVNVHRPCSPRNRGAVRVLTSTCHVVSLTHFNEISIDRVQID